MPTAMPTIVNVWLILVVSATATGVDGEVIVSVCA
jgi:hypothetical protein